MSSRCSLSQAMPFGDAWSSASVTRESRFKPAELAGDLAVDGGERSDWLPRNGEAGLAGGPESVPRAAGWFRFYRGRGDERKKRIARHEIFH